MSLDLPVVAFTLVAALVTGITFGVVPAFVSTSHARDAMREGGRHGGGRRLHRVLSSLVVAEVALSLVLLAGAGLLMRSIVKLQSVDLGFRVDGVLTASVQLPASRYDFLHGQPVLPRCASRASPRSRASSRVAGASCMPMPDHCIGTSFWRADRPRPADGQLTSGQVRPVTPASSRRWAFHRSPDATSPIPTPSTRRRWRSSARTGARSSSRTADPLGPAPPRQRQSCQRQERHGMDDRRRGRRHQVVA